MTDTSVGTGGVAIVGGGPLCVYALERLAGLALAHGCRPLAITVFERSGRFGAGEVNSDTQAPTGLMNRIVAQVGFAADESHTEAGPLLPCSMRPTLYEWLQQRQDTGAAPLPPVRPQDIPSRQLHGKALREAFDRFADLLRQAGFSIDLQTEEVIDVLPGEQGKAPFLLQARSARRFPAQRILFVTGNAHNFQPSSPVPRADGSWKNPIEPVYPVERQLTLSRVPAGCTVGIDGFGLTAIDAILHLSEGRGGVFRKTGARGGSGLAYLASGREPARIIPFSPSGLPPCCRPDNFKLSDQALHYRGHYFTVNAIERLRKCHGSPSGLRHGRPQLDFDSSVLPLVVLELARAYYGTLLSEEAWSYMETMAHDRYEAFLAGAPPRGERGIEHLLDPIQRCFDEWALAGSVEPSLRFDWKGLLHPLPADKARGASWAERIQRFMAWDLANGREGNLDNPLKAACDGVFRDLRSVFCAVVDQGGLHPSSHQRFLGGFLRHCMRLSNGAGLEASSKLLALIEHGLVDASIGPEPQVLNRTDHHVVVGPHTGVTRRVDLLLHGRLKPFDAADPDNALYGNLLRRGWIRRWVNRGQAGASFCPGGLELTERFHPVGSNAEVDTRLTFMGVPAEGQRFFQSAAARPNCNSAVFTALGAWAAECLQVPLDKTHDNNARASLAT